MKPWTGEDGGGWPGCGPLGPPLSEVQSPLRQQVFDRVRAVGLASRTAVARDLRLSPATVGALVGELIEAGLLEEVEPAREGEAGRGRPAVALAVRGAAHAVVGMKIGDREATAVLADFAGVTLATAALPRPAGPMRLEELVEVIAGLFARVTDGRAVSWLGIGMPGFVDSGAGTVQWSSFLWERGEPLAAAVQARLGVPVSVDNDANLVALAELWFGAGRALSDFAVVTIEHGVGMGFVMNHRLYRGAQGLGMELGHTKVELDGALCRCGQRGCLEAYVADYALAREAVTALNWGHKDGAAQALLLESLYDHAKAGNATARAIFRRAGRYLAVGLSNVINLFDPALVILSGERMRYDYLYAAETLAEMESLTIATGRPKPPIEVHARGDLLWARGAAALALSGLTEALLRSGRNRDAPPAMR